MSHTRIAVKVLVRAVLLSLVSVLATVSAHAQDISLNAEVGATIDQPTGVPQIPVGCAAVVSAPFQGISIQLELWGDTFYASVTDGAENFLR